MKRFIIIAVIVCFLVPILIISGCSSTRLVSSWKAPDAIAKRYDKILVFGLMPQKNREARVSIENELVRGFTANGFNAGSAYAEYGPKAMENLKEEEAVAKITDNGYDAVLVIALLDKTKEKNYNPGSVHYRPYTYYNFFWGFYQTVYTRIYEPGYYTESTNYILEANLYDLSTKKLEYSAQTKSFDPSSAESLGMELSQTIIADMMAKDVIQK